MRDLRKLRTKYEIKLDNRHITYLLIGALVVLTIFFGLGVVVGKGLGQLAQIEEAAATTPALEPPGEPTPAKYEFADLSDLATPTPETPFEMPTPDASPDQPALEQPTVTPLPTESDLAPAVEPGQVDVGSLPAPPKEGDYWTVQVGSYPTKEEAMATYNKMTATGNMAAVENADLGDRGLWYRVSVGQYATEAGARAMAEALREREKMDTWVRYVP